MSYRTILVDLSGPEPMQARVAVARSLAVRFDAMLMGLHVTPPPIVAPIWDGGAGAYLPPEALESERKANEEAKQRARVAFEPTAGSGAASIWREAEGSAAHRLAELAHVSDLVVTERGDVLDTAERVTGSGVPVLVLPSGFVGDLGQNVLVAWNGSRESARAVHDALPFLLASRNPAVLCAVGKASAESLDDAVAMLQRHGVRIRPERVDGPDANAGEILLALATAHAADLLVMGAYGHSRLREFVFGGATRHVLRHAALPVLLSS
jgi:nucleotide-binding universal stress UspA family protein